MLLRELYIKNFILIDELHLQFEEGLNVLTGETGAGKSMVVDALELLTGEKASPELVKSDRDKAVLEAVFEVDHASEAAHVLLESGILSEEDDVLAVSREIRNTGKITNRLNGRAVNVSSLAQVTRQILDIHLQHDHQQLLNPKAHVDLLDGFAPHLKKAVEELKNIFALIKKASRRMQEIEENERRREQELEFIDYQIKEIEGAALHEGEDEELERERNRIVNLDKIQNAVNLVEEAIYREQKSAHDQVAKAVAALKGMEEPVLVEVRSFLEEVYFGLKEMAQKISRFSSSLEIEPGRLDEVEGRLAKIDRLKKKYGPTIPDVLRHLQELHRQKEELERVQEIKAEIANELNRLWQEYDGLSKRIRQMRLETAKALEVKVSKELRELAMPEVRFFVAVEEGEPGEKGRDEVAFMFSANPGEEPKPLSLVASGGELSRIVLALKTALADAYKVPVLVFDEIDVGVGGQALQAMGRKLAELSCSHQVILVTHAPQVAAYAGCHISLRKEMGEEGVKIKAFRVEGEERITELSRMLAGDNINDKVVEHARQMLKQASSNR